MFSRLVSGLHSISLTASKKVISFDLSPRLMSLTAVTDDTVTVNVFVYIYRGSTVIPLGLVNVPLSSGNTNAARFNVDFLDGINIVGLPIDNTGKRYIPLLPNDVLKVGALANLTAAKTCWVQASGNDYQ